MQQHPFRRLRHATKLFQQDFAALIGVSTATVASIECGRLPVSWDVAQAVAAKTGAIAADLMAGEPVVEYPRAWHGGIYEHADFIAWKNGSGLMADADRFAECVGAFIKAVPVEMRGEVHARFAQLMFRPNYEQAVNDASRTQRVAGNFDFEDLRGFTRTA